MKTKKSSTKKWILEFLIIFFIFFIFCYSYLLFDRRYINFDNMIETLDNNYIAIILFSFIISIVFTYTHYNEKKKGRQ